MNKSDLNRPLSPDLVALLFVLHPDRFEPIAKARAVVIYGSILYKPIIDVRDIDIFVILDSNAGQTGRILVKIPIKGFGFKNASIYLINEDDYVRDAVHGAFGGRWSVLGYHGYVSTSRLDYDSYHAWGMAGLAHHLNLSLEQKAPDFLRITAPQICSIYPIYAKSIVDFLQNPSMRWRAINVYTRTRPRVIRYLLHIKQVANKLSRRDFKKLYLSSELYTRPVNQGRGIRPLREKLIKTLSLVHQNRDLLVGYCGMRGFLAMINSYSEAFDILDELEESSPISTKGACPLLGLYKLDRSWNTATRIK